jgi:UDP-GlcNAc:undecaprenyl-phosphate GlcNAc-1-phosphate transferase
VFLTLRFTRRRKGFKIKPTDFLILFIALVVPNLPDVWIRSQRLGLFAAKMIVLFFSYEVLIGELRGNLGRLALATMAALAVIGVRAFVG